ncbi:MAG: type I-U CRISPR-associated protein Csx17, partial [Acidobacteriota bacterium]
EGYLDRLRRFARGPGAPGSVRRLVGLLEASLFELARHGGRQRLQEILMVLGELQQVVGASRAARDAGLRPMPALSYRWVREADDRSDEFRVAAALAGIHAEGMPMRCHVAPVSPDEKKGRRWDPESTLAVWSGGGLIPNLLRVLERRILEAERRDLDVKLFGGRPQADLSAVMAFLKGSGGRARIDDRRIGRLLAGLAFVHSPVILPDRERASPPVPAAFAALKPLFAERSTLQKAELLGSEAPLPLPGTVVANLVAGRSQEAVSGAWHRLRVAGLALPKHPAEPPSAAGLDGRRLAAALMVPLRSEDLVRLIGRITIPDKNSEASSGAAEAV